MSSGDADIGAVFRYVKDREKIICVKSQVKAGKDSQKRLF